MAQRPWSGWGGVGHPSAPEHLTHVGVVRTGQRNHVAQGTSRVGERAGLVDTHDVGAGQRLDGRHLLHQRLATASRTTATAMAMLVSSTSPSGIMVIIPAMLPLDRQISG